MNIGMLIRDLRDAKGLSRKNLADAQECDISYWGLENIETGVSDPKISTILRLLNYLDAGLVLRLRDQPGAESYVVTLD